MIGVLDPLWFVSLAVIPLIRWLHQWQAPMSDWPVSALFLWENAIQDDAPGPTKKKPDPAWRRRALFAALLIIALAKPYWQREVDSLTVWVDDSLSMSTVESSNTRLEAVTDSLFRALVESESTWAQIELRSLTDPGRVEFYTGGDSISLADWQNDTTAEPDGPPVSVMSPETSHWLLTDGASEGVRAWARRAPLDRVIQAGAATENSAVTRLAARRSLGTLDGLDILVTVSNTGLDTDARQLELYSGQKLLQTADLSLSPGQTIHWQTQVIAVEQSLTASLTPDDSLPADDGLTIGLQIFRPLAALVDGNCGTALRIAIATHPALRIFNTSANPDLYVSCPRERFPDASGMGAQIRALVSSSQPLRATPTWFPDAGVRQDLLLPAAWVSAGEWPRRVSGTGHKVVFGSADLPLVVIRNKDAGSSSNVGGPAVVDTIIDMSNPRFTSQPEYAAFVAALSDLATGRQLLDEATSTSRDVKASIVKPTKIDVVSSPAPRSQHTVTSSLTAFIVATALILFLLDSVLFLLARRKAGHV